MVERRISVLQTAASGCFTDEPAVDIAVRRALQPPASLSLVLSLPGAESPDLTGALRSVRFRPQIAFIQVSA